MYIIRQIIHLHSPNKEGMLYCCVGKCCYETKEKEAKRHTHHHTVSDNHPHTELCLVGPAWVHTISRLTKGIHSVTSFSWLLNSLDTPNLWLVYWGSFGSHKEVRLPKIYFKVAWFIKGLLYYQKLDNSSYTSVQHTNLGLKDAIHWLLNIGLKDMSLGKLFVPMSCQPNSGQRTLFGKYKMCIEHGSAWKE